MKNTLSLIALATSLAMSAQTTTFELEPSKDNSIYQESGNVSNGQGRLFIGQTCRNDLRRSFLQFDLLEIPENATIESVSLRLNVDLTSPNSSSTEDFFLHSVLKDWGEGSSFGSGKGAPAEAPDVTWTDAMLGTETWDNAGGDFNPNPSATLAIPNAIGSVTFASNPQLVSDVQNWINNPSENFGWIFLGAEDVFCSALRLGSKEGGTSPILEVTFSEESGVGIAESKFSKSINIYPNPSDGLINIALSDIESVEVKQLDISGKTLLSKSFKSNGNIQFNLIGEQGFYFLEIANAKGEKALIKVEKN